MKSIVSLLVLPLLILACNSNPNEKNLETTNNIEKKPAPKNIGTLSQSFDKDAKMTYERKTISVVDSNCTEEKESKCAHVFIDYPVFKGKFSDKVNITIHQKLANILGFGSNDPDLLIDLEEVGNKFLHAYHENVRTTGSDKQWFSECRLMGHSTYENIITVKFETIFMMGGDKPLTYYQIYNFDINTGEEVEIQAYITDPESFFMMAENTFRNSLGYKNNQNLNSKGFEFPNDKFLLSQNMGITNNGVEMIYNSYEIAPNSIGTTVVLIPFEELDGLVDFTRSPTEHNH